MTNSCIPKELIVLGELVATLHRLERDLERTGQPADHHPLQRESAPGKQTAT